LGWFVRRRRRLSLPMMTAISLQALFAPVYPPPPPPPPPPSTSEAAWRPRTGGQSFSMHSILLLRLRSYREKGKILFQLFPNLFFLLRLIITKCFSFRRNKIIIATVQIATTIFFS
jgi:hypothetical protein